MLNKKYFLPVFVFLLVFLLSACQPGELTPIVIRMTATQAPRTATPVPAATEVPTQVEEAPAEEDTSGSNGTSEESPTEVPAEAQTEEPAETVEITFKFTTPFQTIEEVESFVQKIEALDGVELAHANETTITITYDPNVTDVDTLMVQLQQAGKAVEEPEG